MTVAADTAVSDPLAQILFLNLVTDVFLAFALGVGEGEAGTLRQPPRDPREPVLGRPQWIFIAAYGAMLTAATLGALSAGRFWLGLDDDQLVTVSFLTLAFSQIWDIFNMRDPEANLLRNAVTRNPYVWGAIVLCIVILAVAIYLPPQVLRIVPPDIRGGGGAGSEPRAASAWAGACFDPALAKSETSAKR